MKKYIYSNRKEIEAKNANQNNINEINSLQKKEATITKIKDYMNTSLESKQDSFFIKKKSTIGNYAFVEIIHKKTRTNKNLIEAKSKIKNDNLKEQFISKNKLSRNNNENENINGKNTNENISINNSIYFKNETKIYNKHNNNKIIGSKINLRLVEEKKEKEKEEKKETKKDDKKEKEKEEKKDIRKEEKKDQKNEEKKNQKEDYIFTHIRLITSLSKDKNKPKKIDYEDNIPRLFTFKCNINKKYNNTERKNSSISKKETKNLEKKNNHDLHICNSIDGDKKYKKYCKSKETNHQVNESISNKTLNCSFRAINYSHSKPKKLKAMLNKKNILKNHLFQYFSTESKKTICSNLELREEKEKKIYHNNKIFERIILKKKRNNKTISLQKKIFNVNEKDKIIEKENENEKDEKNNEKININNSTPNKRINTSISQHKKLYKITNKSNSPNKEKNNTIKSPDKKNILKAILNTSKSSNKENDKNNSPKISKNNNTINRINKKNSNHYFEINIRIKKNQTKEIKMYENGKYEGIIINGKREKNGIMEYKDGSRYEGEWNNDKQYGKGIFTKNISNNNINLTLVKYIGDFVNDKKEGNGIALYSNGDKYEGEWKNNKQYGKGIVIYSTGGRYEGEWANGKFNGLGIYYLRNGEKYEGKFKDNRYN